MHSKSSAKGPRRCKGWEEARIETARRETSTRRGERKRRGAASTRLEGHQKRSFGAAESFGEAGTQDVI